MQSWTTLTEGAQPRDSPELLVLSQSAGEATTEQVLDWLWHEGVHAVRLNGDDFNGILPFALRLGGGAADTFRVWVDGEPVDLARLPFGWFRRWHSRSNLQYLLDGHETVEEASLGRQVFEFLTNELRELRQVVVETFAGERGLSTPERTGRSKISVLQLAAAEGLRVPATLVTNDRDELRRFLHEHGRIVTKPIGNCMSVDLADGNFLMFTSAVDEELVERLPPRFFPSLFQQRVEKAYELRVFILDGRCWSMAMFSQRSEKTSVDFRGDYGSGSSRSVPYRLPAEVEQKLLRTMEAVKLRTGSADLIRTPDGEYVFLEINPVGQFGMVSAPCNYYLERHVARFLRAECRNEQA